MCCKLYRWKKCKSPEAFGQIYLRGRFVILMVSASVRLLTLCFIKHLEIANTFIKKTYNEDHTLISCYHHKDISTAFN